jgi:hypothetical protein
MDELQFGSTGDDPELKIERTYESNNSREISRTFEWQGRIAITISVMIFLILALIRFAFKILQQRYYVFIASVNFSIFMFGLGLLCFKRIVWCEKNTAIFAPLFYGIIYTYLIILVAIGFGTFECFRCIYGLVAVGLSLPIIAMIIRQILRIRKGKGCCIQVKGIPFANLKCPRIRRRKCCCCSSTKSDFVELNVIAESEAFSILDVANEWSGGGSNVPLFDD